MEVAVSQRNAGPSVLGVPKNAPKVSAERPGKNLLVVVSSDHVTASDILMCIGRRFLPSWATQ